MITRFSKEADEGMAAVEEIPGVTLSIDLLAIKKALERPEPKMPGREEEQALFDLIEQANKEQ